MVTVFVILHFKKAVKTAEQLSNFLVLLIESSE